MEKVCALLGVVAACAVLAAGRTAHCSIYDDFQGVRSAAMGGAHRGIGTSNETITMNPGGMAMMKRYAVEAQYAYTPLDKLSRASFSAVDSKSGPVAGGMAYTHVRGDNDGVDPSLHVFFAGAAYPISQRLAFGVTTRHLRGEYNDASGERRSVNTYSGDFGLSLALPMGFSLGFAYNNVVKTEDTEFTPAGIGIGMAYNAQVLVVGADVFVRTEDEARRARSYHVGAEYFLAQAYALRAGYRREPYVTKSGIDAMENVVSGGIGAVSAGGSIDIAFSRSLERHKNWSIIGALRFFL